MPGRTFTLRQITALAMLLAGLGAGTGLTRAQQPHTEEVQLPLGSVFEILAQEGAPGTQYAWVLSLDRTFLQAGRGRALRTRFSQPGKYLLSAEVVPQGGKSIRRSFVIHVKEDLQHAPPATAVTTEPPNGSGLIGLSENRRLVKIIPPQGTITGLSLDADTNVDEDGDGTPDNDRSSIDTFLESDPVPLFLWVTGEPPQSFALTGIQSDGSPYRQQFTVTIGEAPVIPGPGEEPAPATGGIEYAERENGAVHLRMQEAPPTSTPVLALWDFGDGSQSMHMEPLHAYGSSGTYVVRVRLKDLRDGIDIRDLRQSILVTGSPDAAPGAPTTPPEEEPKPKPGSGSTARIFGRVMRILIFLAGTIAVIAAATFALMALRRGKSLADRLEETDKKMAIGKEGAAPEVAPMTLPDVVEEAPRKTAPAPAAPSATAKTSTPPPPAPAGPVPGWLQSAPAPKAPAAPAPAPAAATTPAALKPAAPPPASTPAPAAAPVPAPAPAPPEPSAPAWAASSAAVLSDTTMPDWLNPTPKKTEPAATPVTPAPAPKPAPSPSAPAPKAAQPAPAPAAPPPSAPAPKLQAPVPSPDGPLPAWLQPKSGGAAPAQPSPVSPPPAPASAPAPAPAEAPKPSTPDLQSSPAQTPNLPSSPTPKPAPVPAASAPASPTSNQQPATSSPAEIVLSEKERERRRLKRQRYRQNKAKREAEAKKTETTAPADPAKPEQRPDDAPVAFIRAESIEQPNKPNEPKKPNPPSESK